MSTFKFEPRFDLGVRGLLPQWKRLLSLRDLRVDVVAGLTVACVAVPLSLAIALASGVPPAVGLVTAIVAGIVCAFFGGTPLQVSGPAAAMAVLVGAIVQEHGVAAIVFVALGCGVLQLVVGVIGFGRFIRLVPMPVIEGFTAGIGAIILIGQLPRALGLPPPPQSHAFDVIVHVRELLHQTRPVALGVTAITLVVLYALPRVTKRIPAHLAAVVLATLAVAFFGLDTQTIGEIPRSLPTPKLPEVPDSASLGAIAGSTLVVFALASLETLLSASAVDKLTGKNAERSDPDQELIGQGLGNIAVSLFSGIPVTGVIARSGTNVQTGAKTRRSAIIHSLALIATVFLFATQIGRIPIAALAAVLFSVAFRMLSPASLRRLWRTSRSDAWIYLVTFATIVVFDLLKGVQWGILAALAIAAVRLGRTRTIASGRRAGDAHVFALDGPLTFLSSLEVDSLRRGMEALERGSAVVFDVSGVTVLDASGSEMLVNLLEHAEQRGLVPFVVGLDEERRKQVAHELGEERARAVIAVDREDLNAKSGGRDGAPRLRAGVARYRSMLRPHQSSLYEKLADRQSPHTLFITCSDSRIQPSLITSTEPGELFVVRDVGNLVPPGERPQPSAVAAAIDYAVGILGVKQIVVCGHSGCGAMRDLVEDRPIPEELANLRLWLDHTEVRTLLRGLPRALDVDAVSRHNVLLQLDRLMSYRLVATKVAAGELALAGWFFDVGSAQIDEWSADKQRFLPLSGALDEEHEEKDERVPPIVIPHPAR